ncbi:glycoside hydrolase family 25 protein [Novosphingobium sp. FKTRR1]|uniref:glycoside hydrolase family 25 protein n=1 Tax=unclassified Novosphingobium TaxID=2644732 RepID=UPI001CF05E5E|nr:glycoside hydrolase family 25 protein [Novosphingobium sp. FKTRR1]
MNKQATRPRGTTRGPTRGAPPRRTAQRATRWRLAAAALLAVLLASGFGWWEARSWMPDRARFPVQGAWLDTTNAPVDWHMLRARGADFVYLTASQGATSRDPLFAEGLDAAREQKLQVGAVHVYDLCAPAEAQAANFVTTVPREAALLPPAIAIDTRPSSCIDLPSDAKLQSELTTFLNQVERHVGKPAILMVSSAIEGRYHLAAMIDRNLWVRQNWLEPGYAGRPWVMWTATDGLRSEGQPAPLRWVVVQP